MNEFFKTKSHVIIFMVAIYLTGLILGFYFERNQTGLWLTELFFFIVLCIFAVSTIYLLNGESIKLALIRAKQKILDEISNSEKPINAFLETKDFFANKELDDALESYKSDVNLMKEISEEIEVDIEKYINHNFLGKAINAHFLNQVSNTMTGLGILGTFVGLAIGLSSFNLSGSADVIAKEIQPLIAGIKVAFHTSIYGLVYSIIFNFYYRKTLATFELSITEFVAIFKRHVVKITNDGNEGSFIKYQKRITDRLDELIGLQKGTLIFQERGTNAAEQITSSLTEKVADVIKEVIIPEISRMREAVEVFAAAAQEDHNEALKTIVDEFIRNMNQNLGESFTNLAQILDETTEQQKRNIDFVKNALENLDNTTAGMKDMKEVVNTIMEHVRDYSQQVEEMQSAVNQNLMSLNIQMEANTELIEKQTSLLNTLEEGEQTARNHLVEIFEKINEQAFTLEGISERVANQLENELDGFANKLEGAITLVSSTSTEAINKLATVNKEAIQEIADSAQDTQSMLHNEYEGFMVSMKEQSELAHKEVAKATETLYNQMTSLVKLFEEQTANFKNANTTFKESLNSEMGAVATNLSKVVDTLSQMNNDLSTKISKVSQEFIEATQNLSVKMEGRTKETFGLFDQELAKISLHLSGTLRKISQNLDKNKEIFDEMADAITNKYDDMQHHLDKMLEYADKLHHSLEYKWNQLNEIGEVKELKEASYLNKLDDK